MQWALVAVNDIIQNIIAYDGVAPYTPPEGQTLMQVNDWLLIGDDINDPEPSILDNLAARYTIEERRTMWSASLLAVRNEQLSKNITVGGNEFWADPGSISLLHEAITIQGLGIDTVFPLNWGLASGAIIELSYSDAQALASAIATRKNLAYANYTVLMGQIAVSDAPELIDINVGWPN